MRKRTTEKYEMKAENANGQDKRTTEIKCRKGRRQKNEWTTETNERMMDGKLRTEKCE